MTKKSNLNIDFEYELLDENQQDVDLREKLALLYATNFVDILWWELHDPSLSNQRYHKLFYYEQNVLKHIILFKYSFNAIKKIFVLNKRCKISIKHIKNISHILFKEFEKVQQIIFEEVFELTTKQSAKMCFEITWHNDVIISNLPKSMEDYMKSLGKATRKQITKDMHRIERDFPGYKVFFLKNEEILHEHIERLFSFHKDTMKNKGKTSFYTDLDRETLHDYVSKSGYGLLCACEIDGKMVSGQVSIIIRDQAHGYINAHDESYNKYSIGQIAMINTIKYLIEQKNIQNYHLENGNLEYKFRYGGVSHNSHNILVFRNYNIYYFWGKIKSALKNFHRKLEMRYKIEYRLSVLLNKMKQI